MKGAGSTASSSCRRALVLTALPVEYNAVREHLDDIKESEDEVGTVYETGVFSAEDQKWLVCLAEVGAGNKNAAAEAVRAVQHFQPEIALFVGVAGGIKDVAIGDVVFGTKLYGYESGKDTDHGFCPRPDVGESAYRLVQRARAEGRRGLLTGEPWGDQPPNVFVAPIAAGEKVVASTASILFKFLRRQYGDALAVEMEGSGFLRALHAYPGIEAAVVRGISDLLHGKSAADATGSQPLASRNAARFALQVLARLAGPGRGETKGDVSPEATRTSEPVGAHSDPWLGSPTVRDPSTHYSHTRDAAPLDLWTPGPTRADIITHYSPLVGTDTAQQLASLSESAISAVGAGDFAAQLDVGQRLIALGTDNKYLQAEGAYLSAEGFRLLADIEPTPPRAAELRQKALEQYRIASELLPMDPRPLRGIGRTLEVRGEYDDALRAFTNAKGLCLMHLGGAGAEQRPDVAHEVLRTTRHLIHCILDMRNTNPQSKWNKETNTRLLEGYLFESDKFHRELLPRFTQSQSWWLIEWFMGFVFLARAWGDVGNTQRMRDSLVFALHARRKLMDSGEPLSTVERSNLRWWLAVARERVAAFAPRTRQLLGELGENLDKNDCRIVFRIIDDILEPAIAPWAGEF